ncbi:MAG: PHP domain-containing protein [Promethearchaeota archaeon]
MTIIDMHVHLSSRSPCSNLSTSQLFHSLSNKIDDICITDHSILSPLRNFHHDDLLIFFGVEITCYEGDLLAYGIKILPQSRKVEHVIHHMYENGGIAVCAHPYSAWHNAFGDEVFNHKFDAIEINGRIKKKENELARKAAKIMNIPLIGGSDAHSPHQLNTYATFFEKKDNWTWRSGTRNKS